MSSMSNNGESEFQAKLRREKATLEATWREKCDFLEAERSELKIRVLELELERQKFKRECDINERFRDDVVALEKQKDDLLQSLLNVSDEVVDLKMSLREKIEGFELEKVKFDEMREKEREKDLKIEDLMKENEGFRKKIGDLEMCKGKFDALLDELRDKMREKGLIIEELNEEIEGFKRKIEDLEKEDLKEKLRNKEKEEKFEEIKKKVEDLEMEKRELLSMIEGLERDKIKTMEENELFKSKIPKLERDVAELVGLKVASDDKLATDRIGEVISKVLKEVDSSIINEQTNRDEKSLEKVDEVSVSHDVEAEQIGVTCTHEQTNRVEKSLEKGASDADQPKCCPDINVKLEEPEAKRLDFETEVSRENEPTCFNSAAPRNVVVLSDSDSDDKAPLPANVHKQKRKFSESLIEKDKNDDGSSADGSNPNHKANRICKEFATPHSQALRKCNDMLGGKAKEPGGFLGDESNQADKLCSPRARDLISSCRRSRAKQ